MDSKNISYIDVSNMESKNPGRERCIDSIFYGYCCFEKGGEEEGLMFQIYSESYSEGT